MGNCFTTKRDVEEEIEGGRLRAASSFDTPYQARESDASEGSSPTFTDIASVPSRHRSPESFPHITLGPRKGRAGEGVEPSVAVSQKERRWGNPTVSFSPSSCPPLLPQRDEHARPRAGDDTEGRLILDSFSLRPASRPPGGERCGPGVPTPPPPPGRCQPHRTARIHATSSRAPGLGLTAVAVCRRERASPR